MILEGEISITHEGQYSKNLKPYDVDTFSGDWKTTAVGTCTDFNVMTAGQKQSELYHLAIEASSSYALKPKAACKTLFLYATFGKFHMQIEITNYMLETGNLMVVEDLNTSAIFLFSDKDFGLVVVEIHD